MEPDTLFAFGHATTPRLRGAHRVLHAVSQGRIPQQSWFRLDRSQVMVNGCPALLSWTGNHVRVHDACPLDAHLFPTRSSRFSRIRRCAFTRETYGGNIPGVSPRQATQRGTLREVWLSGLGNSALALEVWTEDGPVISPYSNFLTFTYAQRLLLEPFADAAMNWMGPLRPFTKRLTTRRTRQPGISAIRMETSQGMCLLALTKLMKNNIVQQCSRHSSRQGRRVLLHEKPLSKETLKETLESIQMEQRTE